MKGQLDFDGFEIQADTISVPGVGKKIGLGQIKADKEVHAGDAFDVMIRMYVGAPAFATDGMDGHGNFKGPFDRHFRAYPDEHRWEVVRYLTKAEVDAEYRNEHGATA